MKLILLCRYDRLGPSSRLRILNHADWLADQGITVQVSPFFGDAYLDHLYRVGRRPLAPVLQAYRRRFAALVRQGGTDAVLWVEKELLPWLPAGIEAPLLRRPYVLDLDDAWHERYARHRNPVVRAMLGGKLARLAAGAAMVVVGNRHLDAWARSAGALRTAVIPTAVDTAAIPAVGAARSGGSFVIGWVGTPGNAVYLRDILPALRRLTDRSGTVLRVVGTGPISLPGVRAEFHAWTPDSEADQLHGFDVGIMPLPDTPWTRGKCGFKILQYFAAGRTAVASPVGANRDIVRHGVNGFLAEGEDAWVDYIGYLRDRPHVRTTMGDAARRTVEHGYSVELYRMRLLAVLRQVWSEGQARPADIPAASAAA